MDEQQESIIPLDEVGQKVAKVKRKRNRPDLAKFGQEYVEPGDNSLYLRHALVSLDLPPIDISDPKQVEGRIREYFEYCAENDRKPNIKGLGNWLGVNRDTVKAWMRGEFRSDTHQAVIQKAYDVIEEMWWDYGQNGKVNPAAWIFIGKNAYGMKDTQDVIVTPNQPLGEPRSAEEIAQQYEFLPEE